MPDQPADLSNPENWWTVAVRQRAEEAEAKFQQTQQTDPDGVVAVALSRPADYEVQVRLRGASKGQKWEAFGGDVVHYKDTKANVYTGDAAAVLVYLDDAFHQMHEEQEQDRQVVAAVNVLLENVPTLAKYLP